MVVGVGWGVTEEGVVGFGVGSYGGGGGRVWGGELRRRGWYGWGWGVKEEWVVVGVGSYGGGGGRVWGGELRRRGWW